MKEFLLHKEIPVIKTTDVLVIGGGTAGCFAAISSAMMGAKTILCEKNGMLGGTVTSAGVNFPGLFYAWGKQIIGGPCWEAIKCTISLDKTELPKFTRFPEKHWYEQILLNRFSFTHVVEQMCLENKVDILMHTMISFAEEKDDGVYAVLTSKEGLFTVKAKTVIDATGDADVCGIMGYERIKSESLQPATLINNIDGYDLNDVNEQLFDKRVSEAVNGGILQEKDTQGGSLYHQLKSKRISMHITDADFSTSGGKTACEIEARSTLHRIVSFLKTIPSLENLYVSYFADECGIRETCRIVGEKSITAEEYLQGYVYDDAICYAFYPIDLHIPTGIKQIFLKEDIVPTIPYGALIPKGSKRLLAAGRCISGDTDSNSACRVQAPCMAMGQAAGIAAAVCAKHGYSVKEVPIDTLRKDLTEIGAIVPEK